MMDVIVMKVNASVTCQRDNLMTALKRLFLESTSLVSFLFTTLESSLRYEDSQILWLCRSYARLLKAIC